MTFAVGDRIAHPLHGAGIVDRIESKRISGAIREYYVMKLAVGDLLVMIPCEHCEKIGVRPIINSNETAKLFEAVPAIDTNMTANWNKRYRENMDRIKSGDLLEVAAVIKGLMQREKERGLSNGERKMLHSAKQILISEVVLAENTTFDEVEARLNACVQ